MARVGRPPVSDPKVSKTVTLLASQWYKIEQSNHSRATIFTKMLEWWSEKGDYDARGMSVQRLLAFAAANALHANDAKYHTWINELREKIAKDKTEVKTE